MNRHQLAMARRRQELVERSASQRSALIDGIEPYLTGPATQPLAAKSVKVDGGNIVLA